MTSIIRKLSTTHEALEAIKETLEDALEGVDEALEALDSMYAEDLPDTQEIDVTLEDLDDLLDGIDFSAVDSIEVTIQ